jgi:cation diffusion facilitator family transporter
MAVAADRTHYAADLASGVVVLIGVISGAFLNAPGLDAAAGLVVAVWLFWGAFGVLKGASDQLLDREVPDADRVALTTAVLSDMRISGVHQLRTRRTGSTLTVQMHIDLDRTLSFEAAHDIVVEAEDRIRAAFPDADVLIHADPTKPVSPWAIADS